MYGLSANNDPSLRGLRSDNKHSHQFTNNLNKRFHVAGVSGGLLKSTRTKVINESINGKLEQIAKQHETPHPVQEHTVEFEIQKDEERLAALQKKLNEVKKQRELKEARAAERKQRKLEYDMATKMQRHFYQAYHNKKWRAVQVLQRVLKCQMWRQSVSVGAWAAKVIRKFAEYATWRWARHKAKLRMALSLAEGSYVSMINQSIDHITEVHNFSANMIENVCLKMTKKVAKSIITKETNERIKEALEKQREVRKSTYGLGKGTAAASTIKPVSGGDVSPYKRGNLKRMASNVKIMTTAFSSPLSRAGSSASLVQDQLTPVSSSKNPFNIPPGMASLNSSISSNTTGSVPPSEITTPVGKSPTNIAEPKLDWRGRPVYTGNYDTTSSETSPAVSGANSPTRAADTATATATDAATDAGTTEADDVNSGTGGKKTDCLDPPAIGGQPRQMSCTSVVTSFVASPRKTLRQRVKAAVKATKEKDEKDRIQAENDAIKAAKDAKLTALIKQINKHSGHHQKKASETDDEYYIRLAEMHQVYVRKTQAEKAQRLKMMEENRKRERQQKREEERRRQEEELQKEERKKGTLDRLREEQLRNARELARVRADRQRKEEAKRVESEAEAAECKLMFLYDPLEQLKDAERKAREETLREKKRHDVMSHKSLEGPKATRSKLWVDNGEDEQCNIGEMSGVPMGGFAPAVHKHPLVPRQDPVLLERAEQRRRQKEEAEARALQEEEEAKLRAKEEAVKKEKVALQRRLAERVAAEHKAKEETEALAKLKAEEVARVQFLAQQALLHPKAKKKLMEEEMEMQIQINMQLELQRQMLAALGVSPSGSGSEGGAVGDVDEAGVETVPATKTTAGFVEKLRSNSGGSHSRSGGDNGGGASRPYSASEMDHTTHESLDSPASNAKTAQNREFGTPSGVNGGIAAHDSPGSQASPESAALHARKLQMLQEQIRLETKLDAYKREKMERLDNRVKKSMAVAKDKVASDKGKTNMSAMYKSYFATQNTNEKEKHCGGGFAGGGGGGGIRSQAANLDAGKESPSLFDMIEKAKLSTHEVPGVDAPVTEANRTGVLKPIEGSKAKALSLAESTRPFEPPPVSIDVFLAQAKPPTLKSIFSGAANTGALASSITPVDIIQTLTKTTTGVTGAAKQQVHSKPQGMGQTLAQAKAKAKAKSKAKSNKAPGKTEKLNPLNKSATTGDLSGTQTETLDGKTAVGTFGKSAGRLPMPDIDTYFQLPNECEAYNDSNSIENDISVIDDMDNISATDIGDRSDYEEFFEENCRGSTADISEVSRLMAEHEQQKASLMLPLDTIGASSGNCDVNKNSNVKTNVKSTNKQQPAVGKGAVKSKGDKDKGTKGSGTEDKPTDMASHLSRLMAGFGDLPPADSGAAFSKAGGGKAGAGAGPKLPLTNNRGISVTGKPSINGGSSNKSKPSFSVHPPPLVSAPVPSAGGLKKSNSNSNSNSSAQSSKRRVRWGDEDEGVDDLDDSQVNTGDFDMLELNSPGRDGDYEDGLGLGEDNDDVLLGSIVYHQTSSKNSNMTGHKQSKPKPKTKTSTKPTMSGPGSDAILMNMIAQLESNAMKGAAASVGVVDAGAEVSMDGEGTGGVTTGRGHVDDMLAQVAMHEPAGDFHLSPLPGPQQSKPAKNKTGSSRQQVGVAIHDDKRSGKVEMPPETPKDTLATTTATTTRGHTPVSARAMTGGSTGRVKTAEKQMEMEFDLQQQGEINDLQDVENAIDRECMELQLKLASMMVPPQPEP